MLSFQDAYDLYRDDEIQTLFEKQEGSRFLKLKAMSRKSHLKGLCDKLDISHEGKKQKEMFRLLYDQEVEISKIDKFINDIHESRIENWDDREKELINELYKVESFGWGGLRGSGLERNIVNNYIKEISSYEKLIEKIENEIFESTRQYTITSWYNHWSTIVIEEIFHRHKRIVPAVGRIKKIDFFFDNVPFDLKVTYLPEGYISDRRSDMNEGREITILKNTADELDLPYDADLSNSVIKQDIWKKLDDHPSDVAQDTISNLSDIRDDILRNAVKDPNRLIKWLYENQGYRRFDSSNRLFLILVDASDYFGSWKLKRANSLLKGEIKSTLDKYGDDPGRSISFERNDNEYTCISDAIIVTKNLE